MHIDAPLDGVTAMLFCPRVDKVEEIVGVDQRIHHRRADPLHAGDVDARHAGRGDRIRIWIANSQGLICHSRHVEPVDVHVVPVVSAAKLGQQ